MTRSRIFVIEGELHLGFDEISQCYACDAAWMREAYEFGLFGPGRLHEGDIVLAARRLDRIADVVRLGFHQGWAFESIALILGHDPIDF